MLIFAEFEDIGKARGELVFNMIMRKDKTSSFWKSLSGIWDEIEMLIKLLKVRKNEIGQHAVTGR